MLEGVVANVLSIPPWAALLVVFALPALEASAFVGVVFPGELAVLLGGVLAAEHRVSLASVLLAAVAGAVLGDQVGYAVGARYGERLLRVLPERIVNPARLDAGRRTIRRLGAKAVVAGRWTASLRALVPGLCGMAGMRYRTFALANLVGGGLWAVTIVLVGYVAGDGWRRAQRALGEASIAAAGLVVVGGLLLLAIRHRRARGRRRAPPPVPTATTPVATPVAAAAIATRMADDRFDAGTPNAGLPG